MLEGHRVTGATERGGRVEVQVEQLGTVSARWAIAADGMWSPMRKFLGVDTPGYLGDWHAFRQYACGVSSVGSTDLCV